MKALRKSLFSALGLAILVGVLAPNSSEAFDRDRVAGSYAGTAQLKSIDGVPVPPDAISVFPLLYMIHPDQTYLLRNPNLFQGVAFGTWKRGELSRQIVGRLEQFEFGPDGFLSRKFFTMYAQTFDEDFATFTGVAVVTFFDCLPEGIAIVCGGPPATSTETLFFEISGTRITAD